MNRRLPLLVAVAALAALLVPTAAFPFSDDADTAVRDMSMSPSDGPNGVYAELEDGELALDLSETNQQLAGDGLNMNSRTVIDDVFTLTYTGPANVTVWLTHEGDRDALQFYRGDDPGQLVHGQAWATTLETNETLHVGLLVDTTVENHDVQQVDSFTVHTERPEDVSLSVATTGTTGVDTGSATLAGELAQLGGATEASVSFEYRERTTSGWNTLPSTTVTAPGEFDQVVTGLAPGTTYEFRAVAETSDESDTGDVQTFTTTEAPSPETPTEPTPTPETPTDPTPEPPGEETPTDPTPETPTSTQGDGDGADGTGGAGGAATDTPTPTPTPTLSETPTPRDSPELDSAEPDQSDETGETLGGFDGGLGVLAGVVSNTFLLLLLALFLGLLVSRVARELAAEDGGD